MTLTLETINELQSILETCESASQHVRIVAGKKLDTMLYQHLTEILDAARRGVAAVPEKEVDHG